MEGKVELISYFLRLPEDGHERDLSLCLSLWSGGGIHLLPWYPASVHQNLTASHTE